MNVAGIRRLPPIEERVTPRRVRFCIGHDLHVRHSLHGGHVSPDRVRRLASEIHVRVGCVQILTPARIEKEIRLRHGVRVLGIDPKDPSGAVAVEVVGTLDTAPEHGHVHGHGCEVQIQAGLVGFLPPQKHAHRPLVLEEERRSAGSISRKEIREEASPAHLLSRVNRGLVAGRIVHVRDLQSIEVTGEFGRGHESPRNGSFSAVAVPASVAGARRPDWLGRPAHGEETDSRIRPRSEERGRAVSKGER